MGSRLARVGLTSFLMAETILPAPPRTTWFPGGQRFAFFALLAGILGLAYYTIRPVLVVLLLAAAVASLSFSSYRRLAAALRGRGRIAAVLLVVAMIAGVLGPLVVLAILGVRRLAEELVAFLPRVGELQAWLE